MGQGRTVRLSSLAPNPSSDGLRGVFILRWPQPGTSRPATVMAVFHISTKRRGAMRLVALTYGTEGDTRPIAVLCRALMDAGHEVSLFADEKTLGSALGLGVPH